MECRKVEEQGHECEVHVLVVGASSFYQNLRFSLLASSWLPLTLGSLVWSALHLVLVFCITLLLVVVVIYLVLMDILLIFYGFPALLIIGVAYDIVAVLMDTLHWFSVMIWVIISCQSTPGKAAKVAYERIGGIRLFCFVLIVAPGIQRNWRFLSRTVNEIIYFWSVQNEPGELGQVGEPGQRRVPGESLRLRMKRWCKEIVPLYDVVRS